MSTFGVSEVTDLKVLFLVYIACEVSVHRLKALQRNQQLWYGGGGPRQGGTKQQAAPVDVLGFIAEQRFNTWDLRMGETRKNLLWSTRTVFYLFEL